MRSLLSASLALAVVGSLTVVDRLDAQGSATTPPPVNFKVNLPASGAAAQPDAQSTDYLLRFQLIHAGDYKGTDASIEAVESVLRDLFKFPGYRLISQAAVSVSAAPTQMGRGGVPSSYSGASETFLSAANDSYLLRVTVNADSASRSAPRLMVTLQRHTRPGFDPAGKMTQPELRSTILTTTVSVALGRTVVLGSTQPGGPGEALILVVRPEVRK